MIFKNMKRMPPKGAGRSRHLAHSREGRWGLSPAEIKALVNTPDGKIDTALVSAGRISRSYRTFRPKAARTVNDYGCARHTIG